MTIATDLGVPRSTARGWLGQAPKVVVSLLRRSGFTLTRERLPDGRAKIRILRAVDRARESVPLGPLLRFLRLSPSRFHA